MSISDTSPGTTGDVFSAAERAGDYIEEDTAVSVPAPPRRRVETPEDSPPIPVVDGPTPAMTVVSTAAPISPAVADRVSTSALFGNSTATMIAASRATNPARATAGFRGFWARLGLPIGPGAAEALERRCGELRTANETIVRQATWTRAVSVLVANPKGGTGKTPTTLLIGGVLAAIRGGSVAILEVSDDRGALNLRAEGNPQLGLGELVRDIDQVTTAGRLAGYTAPQTSFASVIGSTGRRTPLNGESVVAVASVIDEFYGIRVMDSGNVTTSSAFQGAVSVADVLVIPIMNAGDSALEAIELLEELHAAGGASAALASTAIAIRITDGRPENPVVREDIERLLKQTGVSVLHEIPYDAHIAERGQITLSSLKPATRDAFVAAAASVVRALQSAVSAAPLQNWKA